MTGHIEIVYTGTDGSTWDLRRGAVYLMTGGIEGMSLPEHAPRVRTSSAVDGQTYLDGTYKPRDVFFPLRFRGNDVEGTQRRWWAATMEGMYATVSVTDGAGYTRVLKFRPVGDGGLKYGLDPYIWTDAFALEGTADDPLWGGVPVIKSFGVADNNPTNLFFGGTSGGTAFPLYVNAVQDAGDFTVQNPGDVPAWPLWEISGPSTSFVASVNGHVLAGPITIAGTPLLIDTDRRRQTAKIGDTSVITQLTDWDFAPVPRGQTALALSIVGDGRIKATFVPKFRRAF